MNTRVPRRAVLAALGGSFVGVTGCTGEMPWEEALRGPGAEYRPETVSEGDVTAPGLTHGDLLDDFAEPSVWTAIEGTHSVTEDRTLVGDRALWVGNENGRRVGVYRAFDEPLDLDDRQLSVALALDEPADVTVTVECQAPDADHSLISSRRVPPELDDWLRLDVGYTDREGEPDHTSVEGIRIWAERASEERIGFTLDDLRATQSHGSGGVVLAFDGGPGSAYDEILEITEESDSSGVLGVRPSLIDEPGGLPLAYLETFGERGWDVASYPLRSDPLPELPADDQRTVIEADSRRLADLGFEGGARHFLASGNRIDASTLEAVRNTHETGFLSGGAPNAFPPSDLHTLSMADGTDSAVVPRLVELATAYGQLLVLRFGTLTPDAEDTSSTAYLRELVAFLDAREIEVLTASDLLETVDQHSSL